MTATKAGAAAAASSAALRKLDKATTTGLIRGTDIRVDAAGNQ